MKYDNQLRYAVNIIEAYNGSTPLSSWLKEFFRANKQMGSRDRKTVSEMVYAYYRLGHNKYPSAAERIISAIAYTQQLPEITEYFNSKGQTVPTPVSDEVLQGIFPWHGLSDGINLHDFSRSFLVQPDLFIRTRPGRHETVLAKLNNAQTAFRNCGEFCIALPNTTKLDDVIVIDEDAVIQDKSSQQTGSFIKHVSAANLEAEPFSVWDCCAASGGKSIMTYDILSNINITVSDIRLPIIHNLESRFKRAGINQYSSFVADLTSDKTVLPDIKYNLVIADVPCSGSGTWSRTPEQLYFFKKEKIAYYQQLQKRIVSRVTPYVQQSNFFLYITCSVFREENEDMVDFILANSALRLHKKQLFEGYHEKADTLFAALFTN